MAKVVITVEDQPEGVKMHVLADPPMPNPLKFPGALTDAQTLASIMVAAGHDAVAAAEGVSPTIEHVAGEDADGDPVEFKPEDPDAWWRGDG